jgi:protein TonB
MDWTEKQDRLTSALGVALLHAGLAYALVAGLGFELAVPAESRLKLFDVPMVEPLSPIEQAASVQERAPVPEGAAAPPNLRADPAAIIAPEPEIVLPIPPPVVAAPVTATGPAPTAGASDRPGPGTGAGGEGTGGGSGRFGDGDGGGGAATPARQIAGLIVDADYPRAARRARLEGVVRVLFTVSTEGRATDCRIVMSSGHPELDTTTCHLIERRYRFEPARNALGRPVPEDKGWEQVWWLERG